MDARDDIKKLPHSVILEARNRMSVSGVYDVLDYNEVAISADTSEGLMKILGQDMRIETLSIDTGELLILGSIDSIVYEDVTSSGKGLFSRLFR